ncbi:MAG TPA: O-antigen ligase family protein [Blastocatellia bacterium]|nr:O-antigen ligase family protein [Blastocatellia bacterium]
MASAYTEPFDLELNGDIDRAEPRARRRLPLMLIGAAALTLIFVTQVLQIIPPVKDMSVAKFVVLVVALVFLQSRDAVKSRVRISSVPQLRNLLLMIVIALLLVPVSFWPSGSLDYIVNIYARNIIIVYLLVQAARTNRDARVIAGSLVAGCSALVLAMLLRFGPLVTNKFEPGRVSVGGTYDVNDLALLFVITIPFAFFMLKDATLPGRVLLIAGIALMLAGMVKTGSRGGFLGLMLISALIFFRGSKQMRKYTLATMAVGVLLFLCFAPKTYWDRISTIYNYKQDYNFNMKEDNSRLMIWGTGIRIFLTYPVTGVGIAGFQHAHRKFAKTELTISPHNTFLQVATELGVLGLILFVWIIFTSIRTARAARRRARAGDIDPSLFWFASAVEVSFWGFVVCASLLTHAYSPIFCFMASMGAVLYHRYHQSIKTEEVEEIEYA